MEYFIGLIFGCPNKEEKVKCPFKNLRKAPKNLAVELWESLSMNEKRKLVYKHKKCINSCKKESIDLILFNKYFD